MLTHIKTIYSVAVYFISDVAERARKDERGSNTLEVAIIVGAVLVLAVGAVVAITAVVNKYVGKIG